MVGRFIGNSQRVKAVGCFRGGAPSLMFDTILNANLSEEKVFTAGVTPWNLELLLPLILLIHTKQTRQDKACC